MDQPNATAADACDPPTQHLTDTTAKLSPKKPRHLKSIAKYLRRTKVSGEPGILGKMEGKHRKQLQTFRACLAEYSRSKGALMAREQEIVEQLRKKGINVGDPDLDVEKTFRMRCRRRIRKKKCVIESSQSKDKECPCAGREDSPQTGANIGEEKISNQSDSKGHSDTLSKSDEVDRADLAPQDPLIIYQQKVYEGGNLEDGLFEFEGIGQTKEVESYVPHPELPEDAPYIPPAFAQVFGT